MKSAYDFFFYGIGVKPLVCMCVKTIVAQQNRGSQEP